MEENHNSNNGMLPQIRPTGSFLAFWSVLLGGIGLASDCLPLFSIWSLPAGLFSRSDRHRMRRPFQTGKTLYPAGPARSDPVCYLRSMRPYDGIVYCFLYTTPWDTNTPLGQYFRQVFETASQALTATSPSGD